MNPRLSSLPFIVLAPLLFTLRAWPALYFQGGVGFDDQQQAYLEFGHVPDGARETRTVMLCANETLHVQIIRMSDEDIFRLTDEDRLRRIAENRCVDLDIDYIASSQGCRYQPHQGEIEFFVSEEGVQSLLLSINGVSVSEAEWNSTLVETGWRYAGAVKTRYPPYLLRVSDKELVWLGQNDPDRMHGFTHYRLSNETESFLENVNDIDAMDEDYTSLLNYAGSDGVTRINDIAAAEGGLFAGVQPNGYVLVYHGSGYQAPDDHIISPKEPDFWAQRGFGGSPRLCSGPCVYSPCAYSQAVERELFENETEVPGCDVENVIVDCNCDRKFPSKGENIVFSSSGRCLVVTNTFYNEVDTLSFNFTDTSRLNRLYNHKLGNIDLGGKGPELMASDNNNRVVIINRNANTAVICRVSERDRPETPEESICELTECMEFCHPSLKYASGVDFLLLEDADAAVLVLDSLEQRVYLFNSTTGDELGRYPQQPEALPVCGLDNAVSDPENPVVALLYNNPGTILFVQWNGTDFNEVGGFDQTAMHELEDPVSADFSDSGASLYVALKGSGKVIRFQRIPGQGDLPAGLTYVNASANDSSVPSASGSGYRCQVTPINRDVEKCRFGDSSDKASCSRADNNWFDIIIIGSVAGGVLVVTTVASAVITGLIMKKCRSKSKARVLEMTDKLEMM